MGVREWVRGVRVRDVAHIPDVRYVCFMCTHDVFHVLYMHAIILTTVPSHTSHSIIQHGIQFDHGQPIGADLALLGVAGRQRGKADALSKILFQYFMRRDPVTFEHLLHAAAGEGDDGDGDGDGDGGGGCGMTDD